MDTFGNKTIDEMNNELTSIILEAANKSIPRGCRANYKPFWNDKLQRATEEKEAARKEYEQDLDNVGKKIQYRKATAKAKLVTKEAKKKQGLKNVKASILRKEAEKHRIF